MISNVILDMPHKSFEIVYRFASRNERNEKFDGEPSNDDCSCGVHSCGRGACHSAKGLEASNDGASGAGQFTPSHHEQFETCIHTGQRLRLCVQG
jgi:hypothetical protein